MKPITNPGQLIPDHVYYITSNPAAPPTRTILVNDRVVIHVKAGPGNGPLEFSWAVKVLPDQQVHFYKSLPRMLTYHNALVYELEPDEIPIALLAVKLMPEKASKNLSLF